MAFEGVAGKWLLVLALVCSSYPLFPQCAANSDCDVEAMSSGCSGSCCYEFCQVYCSDSGSYCDLYVQCCETGSGITGSSSC